MEGDTTTPAMVGSTNKPSYVSTISVWGQLSLEVTGPRLNSTKEEKTSRMYGPDRRLDLVVAPPMPQLQVSVAKKSAFVSFRDATNSVQLRRVHQKSER